MSLSKKPKVFYGYWILVAAFICAFIDSGSGYYCFSLFVKPLEADLGWSRGTIMSAWFIRFLGVGLSSPFIGKLVDSYGARVIIPIGALIGGLGFVILSLASNLWYFYIGWAAVGVGISGSGVIPGTAVVSNWFKKRRGRALGIMGVGYGAAGLMSPFVGGYLIPHFGWRVSYFALGLLMWMLIPLAILLIRSKPADEGLYPDGVEHPEAVAEVEALPSTAGGMTLKKALATSSLWLIAISFLISSMAETGITQTQVPYCEDIGFPAAMAATTLAVVGIWSAIGKFSFGWLCDHIQAKYARAIGIGFLLGGAIILTSMRATSPAALMWLYAIIKGFGTGSWLPTMSMLTSTIFGLASYGVIFGMIYILNSVGSGVGPLFAGYMYDLMGTYHGAFIVFIILLVVAIPIILVVRRPRLL
jgi:MFS family permease